MNKNTEIHLPTCSFTLYQLSDQHIFKTDFNSNSDDIYGNNNLFRVRQLDG